MSKETETLKMAQNFQPQQETPADSSCKVSPVITEEREVNDCNMIPTEHSVTSSSIGPTDEAGNISNPTVITTTAVANQDTISEIQINEFIDMNFPSETELPSPLHSTEKNSTIIGQSDLTLIQEPTNASSDEYFKCPKAPKRKKPTQPSDNDGLSLSKKTSSRIAEATSDATVLESELNMRKQVNIYTNEQVPQWYEIHPNVPNMSKTIVPSKLPEAFNFLPIFGRPKAKGDLKTFWDNKVRDFIGNGLTDEEYSNLAQYCSPDNLLTGTELEMQSNIPSVGIYCDEIIHKSDDDQTESKLCIVNKFRMRKDKDTSNMYVRRLKYRGIRLMPTSLENEAPSEGTTLVPGKDLIFHIRIYRPFSYQKQKAYRGRHSVFCRDLVMVGRQRLTELRDSFLCANDLDMRVDMSERIADPQLASAKDLFPSGFLFINNVFYVDSRAGCSDISQRIREWAATNRPGLGHFPCKDLSAVTLGELTLRLGHPEVYMHQGNCEHLFTVSEIRLLTALDPLKLSQYPCHTAISQNQTVYCTTCAEFGAKFVVTGCNKVPFDPAFFCDTCLKLYLYKDGKKVCDFKAYSYRGNEMHSMKQQG